MSKAKLVTGVVLIFILGGLTGALSLQLYDRHAFPGHLPRPHSAADRTDFIMDRLEDDLDLTPDQIAEIRPIVESGEQAVTALMDQVEPEMSAIHERGFAAIREKLNPDQQPKLDRIMEKVKRFRRKG